MSNRRFSEEQIIYALKQTEGGRPVREVCRELGVSELLELRQLQEENLQLKGLLADLALDKHTQQEVLSRA
jgi:putative transposase